MSVLNRRSVLKGIATIPVAAALRAATQVLPSSASASKNDAKICAPRPLEMNYVNLVFHGTWIYLIYHDHIQALAPRIESSFSHPVSHVAGMGGSNGIEDVLPPGAYGLNGVEAAPDLPPPDSWQSIIVDADKAGIKKINTSLTNLYYSVRLPFPETMTPVGQMALRLKTGTGKLFQASDRYLDTMFNRPGQRFSSVQVLTYRLTPKIKPAQLDDQDKGCYPDACYPSLAVLPIPDSFLPDFRSSAKGTSQTSPLSPPIPFSSKTYVAPSADGYSQYHLAYVAHRRDESGQHEDHSFSRMMATLGIDVKSSFCDYHFGELPMSIPMGLTHHQVNLDDFPYEIEQNNVKGWYSETEAQQLFTSMTSQLSTRDLMAKTTFSQFLKDRSKPIGNCRSGNVVVTNPPEL
jgi:hypothetical protein